MKNWKKYKEYLLSGEWHIHTNHTDGLNTVDEYCKYAKKYNIPLLAFTEHVRMDITYDFDIYLEEIEKAREKYDIVILSGIEAKVLPSGILDVNDNIIKKVDYCIFAFHSFPINITKYYDSLIKILCNKNIDTWAHPGLFCKKNNESLSSERIKHIFELMEKNEVLLELNKKYNLPPSSWLECASHYSIFKVNGGDCHSIFELI